MQDNQNPNQVVNTEETPEIDIKQLVFIFLNKWYLFTISAVVLLVLGIIYLKFQTPAYQVKTAVLIKEDQNNMQESFLLEDMGMKGFAKSNIDNEIGTFKSPDMICKIVTDLELYTSYRYVHKTRFYEPDLYKNTPIYVRWEDMEPEKIPCAVKLTFTQKSGGKIKLEAEYRGESKTLTIDKLPSIISLPIGKFYIAKHEGYTMEDRPLEVTIINAMSKARGIIGNMNIATTSKQSTQLDISYKTEVRAKGEDFLTALVEEYNRQAAEDKNKVAYNTAVFIEERLKNIAMELGDVEYQVEAFRKQNQVTDLPTQVSSYFTKSSSFDAQSLEIETQLNLITYIQNFISNPENKNKLVPNLGITDPGLISVIQSYNELLMQRERVQSSASEMNPASKQLNSQIATMHESIRASLANEKNASEIALRDLQRENTITTSKIHSIPTVSRQYTDILRQQEVKSALYTYLLQKREETNLTQAGVAPKAKLIARAYSSAGPVSPRRVIVMFVFLLIGLAIPALILFLIDYFQTKITGMGDMANLKDINVIGDIMKIDDFPDHGKLVVKPNDTSVVNEMFRTMRNNLLFMLSEKEQNVILVTSTIAKEGKSFLAANLARSLSLMDKKTILVGADIRNPKLSHIIGIPKREVGFTSYLAGQIQDHNEIIEQIESNFYALQSGPIPPNPNELLSKRRAGELIHELKKEFDYVVIDSAPVGVVSDTFMLSKYADACIYVVRENYSEKDTVSFINNLVHDKRLRNVAVVLNMAVTPKTQGRYKYGYKYSYRYRYGYAQGYESGGND
ncbi:MAG: polysaccharide biosynthesis tyrosine autokinase [Rikenellaceae bacterium]|nr:polysaccharide biosynthesis tyrosine autokinase [Rikenellaceae bacterium]